MNLAEARRPRSGLGPDRSAADLLQQKIDEDPDFRGKYVRFRINEADTEETMKRLADDILPDFSGLDFAE